MKVGTTSGLRGWGLALIGGPATTLGLYHATFAQRIQPNLEDAGQLDQYLHNFAIPMLFGLGLGVAVKLIFSIFGGAISLLQDANNSFTDPMEGKASDQSEWTVGTVAPDTESQTVVQRLQNLSPVKMGLMGGVAGGLVTGVMTQCGIDLPDGAVLELGTHIKIAATILGGFVPAAIIGFFSNALGRRSKQNQLEEERGKPQQSIVTRVTSPVEKEKGQVNQAQKEGSVFALQVQIQRLQDDLKVKNELLRDLNQEFIKVRELSRGGFGIITLIWKVKLNRFEVMKTIKNYKNHSDREKNIFRKRFSQEGRAMSGLKIPESIPKEYENDENAKPRIMNNHPNVVEIYDFKDDPEMGAVIWMEYVDGESLADRIKRTGKLSAKEAVAIAKQTLDALQTAHNDSELKFIHRDISPGNIMIRWEDSLVKLVDFGSVKFKEETSRDIETIAAEFMGKPEYASREHLFGAALTYKTDIWSLGEVLYEMILGKLPFPVNGETSFEKMINKFNAIEKDEVDFSKIPTGLQPILKRMLSRESKDRPNHAEIKTAFDAFLKG